MNVVKNNKNLNALKKGMKFKNYFNKNKYFFNELYKNETIPRNEIVSIVKQILDYETNDEKDELIKNIAKEFVKDHHELFTNSTKNDNEINDENDDENVSKNDDENVSKNDEENHVEKQVEEKLDEIKQDFKDIEQLKDHPDKKHIEEFNSKIEILKEEINKKFEDMIDSHLDLKRSIDEKRNINDRDAKARIENLEDKLEMLYGKQLEENTKQKPQKPSNSKSDVMNKYISFKLNK